LAFTGLHQIMKSCKLKYMFWSAVKGRHDIHHNDTQHNVSQHHYNN